jgi:biopolymer transport protein ExbD
MKFQRSHREEPTLVIAPLIDIVFLLLIFFMVTSHFDIASGVRIKLPKTSHVMFDQKDNKATVVIDASGQSYFEGKKVDMKALEEKLKHLVEEKHMVQLVLQADREVKHGIVVDVMDVAKTAGVNSIVISARWKPEKNL